jgi:parallel beta-helix repeat protein
MDARLDGFKNPIWVVCPLYQENEVAMTKRHYIWAFMVCGFLLLMGVLAVPVPSHAQAETGADVAYQQFEAESATTNAKIITNETAYFTLGSEASGKSYVRLEQTGDAVEFATAQDCDSLIIRYSIPDGAAGGGQEAHLSLSAANNHQEITLSSTLSWVYGSFPWSDNPAKGNAHYFFDDKIITFDNTLPKGTVIKLEKTKTDQADYYLIDCFDTEQRPKTIGQPQDSISITDFGAVADDGKDDVSAITQALSTAAKTGQTMYFPQGTFDISSPVLTKGIMLTKNGLTIAGSGMWHTTLHTETAGFFIRGENITVKNLAIFGRTTVRHDNEPPAIAVESPDNGQSSNIRLENLWIEHTKVGVWANRISKLTLTGSRIRNTLADGINLCREISNSEVSNNDFRNTGDDGIAMWSSAVADTGNKIFKNTVRYPWLANNIAVYGGKNSMVYSNALYDTVGMDGGINISTRFDPQPFAGETIIHNNLMVRTGSFENDSKKEYGAIWVNTESGHANQGTVTVENNTIKDSTYQGVYIFNSGRLTHLTLRNNVMDGGSTYGIEADAQANGETTISGNDITNFPKGALHNESKLKIRENKPKVFIIMLSVAAVLIVAIISIFVVTLIKNENICKQPNR